MLRCNQFLADNVAVKFLRPVTPIYFTYIESSVHDTVGQTGRTIACGIFRQQGVPRYTEFVAVIAYRQYYLVYHGLNELYRYSICNPAYHHAIHIELPS